MGKCKHKWFTGFYGCICETCARWIDFESFIKKYGQDAFDAVEKRTGEIELEFTAGVSMLTPAKELLEKL
jgi:hypothetical protein